MSDGVSLATLALDVDARPVDKLTSALAALDKQSAVTEASTRRAAASAQLLALSQDKAASGVRQMAEAILAAEAAQGGLVRSAELSIQAEAKQAAAVTATTYAMRAGALTAAEYQARQVAQAMAQAGLTESQARLALGMKDLAAETESYARRAAALTASLDPVAKAQQLFGARTAEANALLAAGSITHAEHTRLLGLAKDASDKAAASTRGLASAHVSAVGAFNLSSRAISEFVVIIRELFSGRLSRIPGSLSVLAQQLPFITAGMIGMTLAVAAAALPFLLFAAAVNKAQSELAKIQNALAVTNDAVGMTGDQVEALGKRLAEATHTGVSKAVGELTSLAATGEISGTALALVGDAAIRLSQLTGESADKIGKELVRSFDDAAKGAITLNDHYHFLTLAQSEEIEALQKAGDKQGAYNLLMSDLDGHLKTITPAMGTFQRAWVSIANAIDGAVRALGNVGVAMDNAEKLAKAKAKVASYEAVPGGSLIYAKQIADGNREISGRSIVQNADTLAAQRKAAEDATHKAGIDAHAYLMQVDPSLGGSDTRAQQEIADYKAKVAAALKADPTDKFALADLKDMDVRIAKIEKKYDRADHMKPKAPKREIVDDYSTRNDAADAALAAANTGELQAELALVTGIQARADLEKQIRNQQENAADARTQRMIDAALNDGKMNDAERANVVHKLKEVQDEAAITTLLHNRLIDQQTQAALDAQVLAAKTNAINIQLAGLEGQKALNHSVTAGAVIEKKILDLRYDEQKLHLENVRDNTLLGQTVRDQAAADLKILEITHKTEDVLNARNTTLLKFVTEAGQGASDFAAAFKRHDWGALLDDLQKTLETVQGAFDKYGVAGGIAAGASAIGHAIGGKAGNALGDAASTFIAAAAFVNPIIAAAAAAVVAIFDLAKSKPSNNGAISTFSGNSFSLSGDKRNDATTQLATVASSTILQGQAMLKAAGITLATTIKSIDIGTRDATHILLTDGQALSSAVGDAAAAADTALKAMLSGATYASDAEKKLVTSMLAAGRGFDDISAAIAGYTAAQTLQSSISDAILQLTDPQAFDLSQAKVAQDARDASVKAAADAGYLTADQFAAITVQLTRLKALEIDKVMQKYGAAISSATLDAANTAVDAARNDLTNAYQAQATALKATIDKFTQLRTTLTAYRATLDQSLGGQTGYDAAKAAFEAAKAGDGSALPAAGQAFLAASLATSKTSLDYLRDLADVKNAVQSAADSATSQVDAATAQLAALDEQVSGLITINKSVLSVVDAIKALQAALTAQADAVAAATADTTPAPVTVVPAPGAAANDNPTPTVNPASIPDAITAAIQAQFSGGGSSRNFGVGGVQMFASGGIFTNGIVSQPTSFNPAMMGEAGPEAVMPLVRVPGGLAVRSTGSGDNVSLLSEIRQMRAEARAAAVALAISNAQTAKILKNWDGNGQPASRGY